MRLSAANPRLPNRNLKLIRRSLPKAATQSHPAVKVPIPPESYRGLHLVPKRQPNPQKTAPAGRLRPLSALRDRVTALAATLLLILAAT